jgi:hypothetical protein
MGEKLLSRRDGAIMLSLWDEYILRADREPTTGIPTYPTDGLVPCEHVL